MPFTVEGKHVIVLGDTTTHGGKVIAGADAFTYMGIPVARVGDMVECPQCGGTYPIVEGAPAFFDHGKLVALHGCKVACGATLISRYHVADTGILSASAATGVATDVGAVSPFQADPQFDEQVQASGAGALVGYPFFIEAPNGQTSFGRLDDASRLPRIYTDAANSYTVYWGDKALEKQTGA